jgi:hypothetical protein
MNMKAFLLYLLYKDLLYCLFGIVLLHKCKISEFGFLEMLLESPLTAIIMLVSITLGIGLALMFVVTLKFVMINKTMNEVSFGIPTAHYDRTTIPNLKEVFGRNMAGWLNPFVRPYSERLESD